MKIALMAPAGAMHRFKGSFSKSLHYAPLTLTTLAALISHHISDDITIYDETAGNLPLNPEADLIAMTAITGTSMRAYAWADYYRSLKLPVVLGGIHPTLLPGEAKMHADSVVTGFAEQSWPQLLSDFSKGVLNEFYRADDDVSLENRPAPRRDLLNKKRYITMNTVEVVRGCRHDCNFCVIPSVFGRKAWPRPVKEVIREIESLPGKLVLFPDVNLIANPIYAKEFFNELIPLKKKWFGLVTTNIGENAELFELMVKSGCKGLLIGFESVNENSISSVNKPFNHAQEYGQLVRKLHENGIGINGTFVFGSDGDDLSVFEKTVEFAQKLRIDLPRYALFTPFPGTELFRQFDSAGRIIEKNWAMYDVEHCVIKPAQMSPDQLEEGLAWAWNETYKTKSIFERIITPEPLFFFNLPLNMGYKMYAKKLSRFSKTIMTDNSDIPQI